MYLKSGEQYASPFIGSLFESDEQYAKFCENFATYLNMEPVFAQEKMIQSISTYPDAPVMFLGDIEIHWPHEKHGVAGLLEKYLRRRERVKDPIFVWSDMQAYNNASSDLIGRFKRIPGSLFTHKDDIETHRDKSLHDRNPPVVKTGVASGFTTVKWLDYNIMASHVLDKLGKKHSDLVMSFDENNT